MQIETSTVIATRYWGLDEIDLDRLARFIRHARTLSVPVAVAINEGKDVSLARLNLEKKMFPGTLASWNVVLLHVKEWVGVTVALNALMTLVGERWPGAVRICFLSVEVLPTNFQFKILNSRVEQGALVAGAVMVGHSPEKGLAARTPWNTFAVWDLQRLQVMGGFPSIADTVEPPGMEEVGAIIQAKLIFSESDTNVLLLHFKGGVDWRSVPTGPRLVRHICKMKSKDRRAEEIRLALLGDKAISYKAQWINVSQ